MFRCKALKDMLWPSVGIESIRTDLLKQLLKQHFGKGIAFWLPKNKKFGELVFAADLEIGEVIEAFSAFHVVANESFL